MVAFCQLCYLKNDDDNNNNVWVSVAGNAFCIFVKLRNYWQPSLNRTCSLCWYWYWSSAS